MAQLPLYHSKHTSRRSFSFRDRHLLLIILAVFAIICLGSLYYAPEVMEQVSFDTTYRKFIGLQGEANVIVSDDFVMDDQVSPSKTPSDNEIVDVVQNDPDEPLQVVDDREEAEDTQNNVEVRRDVEEQRDPEDGGDANEGIVEQDVEQAAEQPDNKNNINVENENPDPVAEQRREKVKEVHTAVYAQLVIHILCKKYVQENCLMIKTLLVDSCIDCIIIV